MRPMMIISLLLLTAAGCMTQRDQTVWQEFKAEISSEKAEVKSEAAAPAPAEKIQE